MRSRLVAAALTLAALAAPALAHAGQRVLTEVSRTASAGNQPADAIYGGNSADGTRSWFTTSEGLVPGDTNGQADVYERSGSTLTLVSVGDSDPSHAASGGFVAASSDGSSVVFSTSAGLVPEDDDGNADWYVRRGGHTYLVTRPENGKFIALGGTPLTGQVTPDGRHVYFFTLEDLAESDNNFNIDLYEWSADDLQAHLESAAPDGTTASGGVSINVVAVGSDDGSKAFWSTRAALVPEDTDTSLDIYERANGQTTLVTTTTSATPDDALLRQISRDGSHVFFDSFEPLAPEDTDANRDVYEVVNGGASQLVSVGTQAGPTSEDAQFQHASDDGSFVWFTTLEQIVPEDTDANQDIYRRHAGVTDWETRGPTGGNDGFDDIIFARVTPDGSRMYFTTHEALTADDQDFSVDVYERRDGVATRRVSVAAAPYDNGFPDANFAAASPDGARVIFQADLPMADADTDTTDDLYEYDGATTTLLTGGTRNIDAVFGGASADASHVFFSTPESLEAGDTDMSVDVYENSVYRPPPANVPEPGGGAGTPADAPAGGDSGPTTPPPPGPPGERRPHLSAATRDSMLVSDGRLDVVCALDSGELGSCRVDAYAGSTAAALVRVGSGSARFAGRRRGTVHVRLTAAAVKRLRARRRASRLVLRVRAHAAGSGRVVSTRRGVTVLLAGTELPVRGRFGGFDAKLPARVRLSLARLAHDLRAARVVRCEGYAAGSSHGPLAYALGLRRAQAACSWLRRAGVHARLRAISFGNTRTRQRKVALRVIR